MMGMQRRGLLQLQGERELHAKNEKERREEDHTRLSGDDAPVADGDGKRAATMLQLRWWLTGLHGIRQEGEGGFTREMEKRKMRVCFYFSFPFFISFNNYNLIGIFNLFSPIQRRNFNASTNLLTNVDRKIPTSFRERNY